MSNLDEYVAAPLSATEGEKVLTDVFVPVQSYRATARLSIDSRDASARTVL